MSRYNVECSTCGIHIGYVYHSGPIGWTNCVQCGDAEQGRAEQEEDDELISDIEEEPSGEELSGLDEDLGELSDGLDLDIDKDMN